MNEQIKQLSCHRDPKTRCMARPNAPERLITGLHWSRQTQLLGYMNEQIKKMSDSINFHWIKMVSFAFNFRICYQVPFSTDPFPASWWSWCVRTFQLIRLKTIKNLVYGWNRPCQIIRTPSWEINKNILNYLWYTPGIRYEPYVVWDEIDMPTRRTPDPCPMVHRAFPEFGLPLHDHPTHLLFAACQSLINFCGPATHYMPLGGVIFAHRRWDK